MRTLALSLVLGLAAAVQAQTLVSPSGPVLDAGLQNQVTLVADVACQFKVVSLETSQAVDVQQIGPASAQTTIQCGERLQVFMSKDNWATQTQAVVACPLFGGTVSIPVSVKQTRLYAIQAGINGQPNQVSCFNGYEMVYTQPTGKPGSEKPNLYTVFEITITNPKTGWSVSGQGNSLPTFFFGDPGKDKLKPGDKVEVLIKARMYPNSVLGSSWNNWSFGTYGTSLCYKAKTLKVEHGPQCPCNGDGDGGDGKGKDRD